MDKPIKSEIFVRNPYNYDRELASIESGLKCLDPTLAQQSFAEECDINTIVERFHLTGEVPQLQQLPAYGDYTGIFDFQTAMNAIRHANEDFMSLPANIRARFHNDPQEFLDFCADANNKPEAQRMGLLATPLPGDPPEAATSGPAATSGTKTPDVPPNDPVTTQPVKTT